MSKQCDLLLDYFNYQLTDEEAKDFAQHLKTCPTCQEELDELYELTADLPYSSEPVAPPVDMKKRVLGNIVSGITKDSDEKEATDARIKLSKTDENNKAAPQASDVESSKKAVVNPSSTPKIRKRHWYQPVIAAVLALSLIGNAVALLYFTNKETEIAEPPKEDLLDSIAQMISLEPSEGVNAKAIAMMINQDSDMNLVIHAEDLPALKGDEAYQVWVLEDGEPSPAGSFVLNDSGEGAVSHVLQSDSLQKWDTIAITKEPDANSQTPKGDILFSAPI